MLIFTARGAKVLASRLPITTFQLKGAVTNLFLLFLQKIAK